MADLVGLEFEPETLQGLLPMSVNMFGLLKAEASRRGWRYGRPTTPPIQHRVNLGATKKVLARLKVSQ